VHYIGDLHEGGHLRNIYEGLGVSQDLTFCELNPDGYDHIIVGDKRVDFSKGKENLIERLKSRSPHEAKGIDSYFADLINMVESLSRIGNFNKPIQSAVSAPTILKWMRATGADLINAHISDPVLRGVLAGQSGDHPSTGSEQAPCRLRRLALSSSKGRPSCTRASPVIISTADIIRWVARSRCRAHSSGR